MRIGIHLDPSARLATAAAVGMITSAAEQMGYEALWIGAAEGAEHEQVVAMIGQAADLSSTLRLGLAFEHAPAPSDALARAVWDPTWLTGGRRLRAAVVGPDVKARRIPSHRLVRLVPRATPDESDRSDGSGGTARAAAGAELEMILRLDLDVGPSCVDLAVAEVRDADLDGVAEVVLRVVHDDGVDQLLDHWARVTDAVVDGDRVVR